MKVLLDALKSINKPEVLRLRDPGWSEHSIYQALAQQGPPPTMSA